ncbi:hypothetical protein GS462_11245 [Rhodococcus hoagii]|nr:hypothetical protein [Prescottella equi]MBM4650987.1 hypothetical protein [Prescottella equi]MBM4686666.1 hypothetical protein [Prescottella equi]
MAVFEIPASGADNPENFFEFKLTSDGPTYRLPFMQYLPEPAIEFLEDPVSHRLGEYTFVRTLVEKTDPEIAKALKGLPFDRMVGKYKLVDTGKKDSDGEPIMKREVVKHGIHSAWADAGKVTEGESSASDDS